jgi:hypothetical protein
MKGLGTGDHIEGVEVQPYDIGKRVVSADEVIELAYAITLPRSFDDRMLKASKMTKLLLDSIMPSAYINEYKQGEKT